MFFVTGRNKLNGARDILATARQTLIVTGAGISAASGVPMFRGRHGLWRYPEFWKFAHPRGHEREPQLAWDTFEYARVLCELCQPNDGHRALATFASRRAVCLFTQNVDGLHARAGSEAHEMHGSLQRYRCVSELCRYSSLPSLRQQQVPTSWCPSCGRRLRHDVVLFGEQVRCWDDYQQAIRTCDALLLVGTSGMVTNTAGLVRRFRQTRRWVIEVNPALFTPATPWTSVSVRGPAEEILPELLEV